MPVYQGSRWFLKFFISTSKAEVQVRSSFLTTTVREQHPRSYYKGATGRVRTGDQRYPVLFHCQLGQDIPSVFDKAVFYLWFMSVTVVSHDRTQKKIVHFCLLRGAGPGGLRRGQPEELGLPEPPASSSGEATGRSDSLSESHSESLLSSVPPRPSKRHAGCHGHGTVAQARRDRQPGSNWQQRSRYTDSNGDRLQSRSRAGPRQLSSY